MKEIDSRWSPPRASLADLAAQVRDVLADLPHFVVSPLWRRRHLTSGATRAEAYAPMPGDGLLSRAQYHATRAITIGAAPDRVWPWLVQVGVGRGGWYADDLLDNLARPSLRRIVPELQDLRAGQRLPMIPHSGERTAFTVDSYDVPRWLLWRTPNRTFAWRLTPLAGGRTRLVARMRVRYEWQRPLTPFTVLLMELADYPMMRRMLRGIRERAEAGTDQAGAVTNRGAARSQEQNGGRT
jgi:hypothetical protein